MRRPRRKVPLEKNYCSNDCEPNIVEYEPGTIVIDVVNTRTNRVVWRGWKK